MLTALREWSQKRRLRAMLKDPRSKRGFRSMAQLEKGIGADRSTTERLLLSIGARKAEGPCSVTDRIHDPPNTRPRTTKFARQSLRGWQGRPECHVLVASA